METLDCIRTRRSVRKYTGESIPRQTLEKILAAAAWAMDRFLHLPAGVCYLLAAAAAFGGGYGLNALISKTPVLRWCVLGKRKEKRHVSG